MAMIGDEALQVTKAARQPGIAKRVAPTGALCRHAIGRKGFVVQSVILV